VGPRPKFPLETRVYPFPRWMFERRALCFKRSPLQDVGVTLKFFPPPHSKKSGIPSFIKGRVLVDPTCYGSPTEPFLLYKGFLCRMSRGISLEEISSAGRREVIIVSCHPLPLSRIREGGTPFRRRINQPLPFLRERIATRRPDHYDGVYPTDGLFLVMNLSSPGGVELCLPAVSRHSLFRTAFFWTAESFPLKLPLWEEVSSSRQSDSLPQSGFPFFKALCMSIFPGRGGFPLKAKSTEVPFLPK